MKYTYSKDKSFRYYRGTCPACGSPVDIRDFKRSAKDWVRDREDAVTPNTDAAKTSCPRCGASEFDAPKNQVGGQKLIPPPPIVPEKDRRVSGEFIIHVNQAFLAAARKQGREDVPTLIVRRGSKRWYCRGVEFISVSGKLAGAGIVPQLDCGARTYAAITGTIRLIDAMNFHEARALLKEKKPDAVDHQQAPSQDLGLCKRA
jgi:ribosomal protein L37E